MGGVPASLGNRERDGIRLCATATVEFGITAGDMEAGASKMLAESKPICIADPLQTAERALEQMGCAKSALQQFYKSLNSASASNAKFIVMAGIRDIESVCAARLVQIALQREGIKAFADVENESPQMEVVNAAAKCAVIVVLTEASLCDLGLAARLALIARDSEAILAPLVIAKGFRMPDRQTFVNISGTGRPLASSAADLEAKVNALLPASAGKGAISSQEVSQAFLKLLARAPMPLDTANASETEIRKTCIFLTERINAMRSAASASSERFNSFTKAIAEAEKTSDVFLVKL